MRETLQNIIDRLRNEIDQKKEFINTLKNEKRDIEKQLKTYERNYNNSQDFIDKIKTEKRELQQKLEKIKRDYSSAQDFINTIKKEKREAVFELKSIQWKYENAEDHIDTLNQILDNRDERIDRLLLKVDKKEDYISRLKKNISELEEEIEDLYKEKKDKIRKQKNKTIEEIGDDGENMITATLKKMKNFGSALDNISFYYGKNKHSVQIDHVFISNRGIFVIETKNWNGELKQTSDPETWLFSNNVEKNLVRRNPKYQNETHIKQIKKVAELDASVPIFSIVVFTGNTVFNFKRDESFLKIEEMEKYILKKPSVFSDEETKKLAKKINDINQVISHEEHMKNLEGRKFRRDGK